MTGAADGQPDADVEILRDLGVEHAGVEVERWLRIDFEAGHGVEALPVAGGVATPEDGGCLVVW
jgi:hypothetical protein